MSSECRTRSHDQPEEEKSDASVEYDPDSGLYIIANSNGHFSLVINHCPWCAAALPPKAEMLASIEQAMKHASSRARIDVADNQS
jgi:hypothetical protein